jgi:hypothetical protein
MEDIPVVFYTADIKNSAASRINFSIGKNNGVFSFQILSSDSRVMGRKKEYRGEIRFILDSPSDIWNAAFKIFHSTGHDGLSSHIRR